MDAANQRDSEAVVLPVTRAAGLTFALSASLLADFTAGRTGWRQFEGRYIARGRSWREDGAGRGARRSSGAAPALR